jgi:GntR family transcriptional regulator
MALRRSSVQHEARRLRDLLAVQICGGRFDSELLGEPSWLPSEIDLMRTYNCSRAAVREALNLLRREGLLDRLQGRGTLILTRPRTFSIDPPGRARSRLQRGDFGPVASLLLDRRMVRLPDLVAEELSVRPGTDGLLFDSLFVAGEETLSVITNYLRPPEALAVAALPVRDDYYALLSAAGVQIEHHETVTQPKIADENIANLLTIPIGSPVTWFEERMFDYSGKCVNFAVGWSRGDIIRSLVRFPHPTTANLDEAI